MHHAARNGQVNLTVRRKVLCGGMYLIQELGG
jgi:atrophin-1 interacting protein 1